MLKYVDQLDDCIEADVVAHRTSDMNSLFYWFSFDVMGDFIFNKSFNMLQNQEWHHMIVILQRAMSILGPFSPAPWIVQVGLKLMPRVGLLKDWFTMLSWCEDQMQERMRVVSDTRIDTSETF